jgi:hypothetical protein
VCVTHHEMIDTSFHYSIVAHLRAIFYRDCHKMQLPYPSTLKTRSEKELIVRTSLCSQTLDKKRDTVLNVDLYKLAYD